MKKSLIALAVAGAFVAPVAMADSNVVVYGVANVSVDVTNTGSNTAGTPGFSSNKVSSNTSRLGLKGNEDLGNGLTAVWQVESLISIDGGSNGAAAAPTNGLATRNTFAGLNGGFGTVLLGRHDTPYKMATRSYDLFGDTIADNRAVMGGGLNTVTAAVPAPNRAPAGTLPTGAAASFDGRQTDVLAYVSPNLGGFTGIVAYVAGAEGQTLATQTKGSAWSLAGMYGNGPFSMNLAYEVHDLGTAPGTLGGGAAGFSLKESAWKLGAGYKADMFEVNAVYEKTKDNFGGVLAVLGVAPVNADLFGHHAYYLSGRVNVTANDAIKLAYGKAGNLAVVGIGGMSNTGAAQASVGYDHSFTKRTTLYALYTQLSNQANATYALGNAGIGNGNVFLNGAGSKPSAFSLGVKHSF
ncbi:porin [Ferriphaselus sp. R-1]|uniref:porin n=1 Tax=Ferriphaselus sp. R-1 TaxID=1485544 RepID=UPI00055691C0|nr:porin [Ferriphaselus sp. R-1]